MNGKITTGEVKTINISYGDAVYNLEQEGEFGRDGFRNQVIETAKIIPSDLDDPKQIEDFFENTIHIGIDTLRNEEKPYRSTFEQYNKLREGVSPQILRAMGDRGQLSHEDILLFQLIIPSVEAYTSGIVFKLEVQVYQLFTVLNTLGRLRGAIIENKITYEDCLVEPTKFNTEDKELPFPPTYLDLFGETLLKAMFAQYSKYQTK